MYPSRKQSSPKNASRTMQHPWEETPSTGACGEFMPNGEEGTIEALTCSACSCHRKEIQEEPSFHDPISRYHHNVTNPSTIIGRKVFLRPHQMFTCSGNMESQDEGDGHGSVGGMFAAMNSPLLVKKRFRTKFSQNCSCLQKKLVGKCTSKKKVWCNSPTGRYVKRRVLKVWMHDNKKNLAKKYNPMFDS